MTLHAVTKPVFQTVIHKRPRAGYVTDFGEMARTERRFWNR